VLGLAHNRRYCCCCTSGCWSLLEGASPALTTAQHGTARLPLCSLYTAVLVCRCVRSAGGPRGCNQITGYVIMWQRLRHYVSEERHCRERARKEAKGKRANKVQSVKINFGNTQSCFMWLQCRYFRFTHDTVNIPAA
jgi:hypothetical protein